MRVLLIIAIVVIIAYFVHNYATKAIDKITFSPPKFEGVDLLSIVNTTGFSQINLSTVISNTNNFNIPVNGLYLELLYQGNIIGKSTDPSERFIIPSNGEIKVTQNITLSLANSIGIAAKLVARQPIEFTYRVEATLFNVFPLNYTDTFTYTR